MLIAEETEKWGKVVKFSGANSRIEIIVPRRAMTNTALGSLLF
jgi:hypothetical protein